MAPAAPWLLHAPPWPDDDHGVQQAHKRVRTDPSTAAEQTLRKYAISAASKLALIGNWFDFVIAERGQPDIAPNVSALPPQSS